jgi:hypothetical protein
LIVPRDALEKIIEITKQTTDIKKEISQADVFDFSLVREILKEMGESPS